MKNIIATLALSSFFVFSACKKTDPKDAGQTQTETQEPQKFIVDSVKVNDSTKISDSLSVQYSSKFLVFPTIKDKKLLDSIYFGNKGINDFSKEGLQNLLQKEKNEYFASIKKDSKDLASLPFNQDWNSDFTMTLKSNNNDFMHIEYLSSSYEGGAHGNYNYAERVFDLKNNKKVELKDITSMPKNKMEGILMKNINKLNSGTTDADGEVKNSDMLLVEVIPASDNFYFDDKNLYFHYSPYEIAAYAAGDIVIPVSWEDLKGTLIPTFKERMKIK
ncbi:DUF3298 and DUF4163 domain-containing protein [Chryseobacterium paludis]|uniref:DUF3298 and DUF4163 domain-containing protein n=1 Tax=Chryseobacterium paludis TaxID=2956784 RepID=UPI0021C140F0|nr:DUF3298 and DUF4163 domain-containing protein [Chryseobacterium paludis]